MSAAMDPLWSKNSSEPQFAEKHRRFDSHRGSAQRAQPQRPVNTTQAPCSALTLPPTLQPQHRPGNPAPHISGP